MQYQKTCKFLVLAEEREMDSTVPLYVNGILVQECLPCIVRKQHRIILVFAIYEMTAAYPVILCIWQSVRSSTTSNTLTCVQHCTSTCAQVLNKQRHMCEHD